MKDGTSLPSPPLLFIAFFTSHRSALSERLEQATPFETVILYNFWAILPNEIGKHAQVKHFSNRSTKHARFTTD